MFLKPHLTMTSLTSLPWVPFHLFNVPKPPALAFRRFEYRQSFHAPWMENTSALRLLYPLHPEVNKIQTSRMSQIQWVANARKIKNVQCARIVHLEFDWCSFAPNRNSNELWPRSQTIQNSCSQWWVPGKWNHRNRAKTSKTNKTTYFFVIVSDANRHCAAQWPHRLHIR